MAAAMYCSSLAVWSRFSQMHSAIAAFESVSSANADPASRCQVNFERSLGSYSLNFGSGLGPIFAGGAIAIALGSKAADVSRCCGGFDRV